MAQRSLVSCYRCRNRIICCGIFRPLDCLSDALLLKSAECYYKGKVQSGIKMVTVYLSLGSNLGDRHYNLDRALNYLSQRLRLEKVSSIYDTEPVGNTKQPRFLNLVCQVSTGLEPMALLTRAKGSESKLGRLPHTSGEPRPIDIDILFYGDQVIETLELVIPHPRLTERAFVLIPLDEIAPDMVHPVSGKTVQELMKGTVDVQGVFKWEDKEI